MTFTSLLAVAIGMIVVSVLSHGVILWLCCLIFRVKEYTAGRIASVVVLSTLISLVLFAIVFGIDALSQTLGETSLLLILAAALAGVVANCIVIQRVLETGVWKALGIYVAATASSQVATTLLAVAITATFAETFVVPTGAMAPTVRGQHASIDCPNCGIEFPVGLSEKYLIHNAYLLDQERVQCANCGFADIQIDDRKLFSGDRILVDKTGRTPSRWHLVTFYPPLNQPPGAPPPPKDTYIKRLVGLPGERIDIVQGDIFVDGQRMKKSPNTVEELWLPVFHSAHRPKQSSSESPIWGADTPANFHWQDEGAWECSTNDDAPTLRVDYNGSCNDHCPYNVIDQQVANQQVFDWRMTVSLEAIAGAGGIGFQWSVAPGDCYCFITRDGTITMAEGAFEHDSAMIEPLESGESLKPGTLLEFARRDGQVYMIVNGVVVMETRVAPDGIEAALPSDEEGEPLEGTVTFLVHNCDVTLGEVRLHRDVHYRTLEEMGPYIDPNLATSWNLAEDEYFFLGDNSPNSMDSRFFGPAQGAAIVGAAKWIYWPPDRMREFP